MGNKDCVQLNGRPCTLHSKRAGKPKTVSKPCPSCREWRCKTHCRCGRNNWAKGRHAARVFGAAITGRSAAGIAPAAPAPGVAVPVLSPPPPPCPGPVGRPVKTDVAVYYDDNGWWDLVVGEISEASSVILASYLYDDEQLHSALVRRLKHQKGKFSCVVLVDEQCYKERTCRGELAKLKELISAGAQVFSCSGQSGKDLFGPKALPGYFHIKAIAIDGKIVYHGSSNLTKSSRKNVELVTRMVGSPALAVVQGLSKSQASGHRL